MLPRRLSTGIAYTPIGALQTKIVLLAPSTRRDAQGEFLPTSPFATVFAAVVALAGNELLKAQQIVSDVTHRVSLRYLAGVTSAMTVQLADGRLFVIKAVQDPDERKFELRLLCSERNEGQAAEQ